MNEKEIDQSTEELFGVVNAHASDTKAQGELAREKAAKLKERRTKATLGLILRLLVCALAAVLFLAALLMPEWVPVLCFTGLGVCLIVGTVVVGRFRNAWR